MKRHVSKFKTDEIRSVMASNMRNLGVSGTMSYGARFQEAAGSDSRRNGKLSGPATKFGYIGRRNSIGKHPEE